MKNKSRVIVGNIIPFNIPLYILNLNYSYDLEQSNKVRLEAIKQRALEKKAEKDNITQALRKNDGSTVIKYF